MYTSLTDLYPLSLHDALPIYELLSCHSQNPFHTHSSICKNDCRWEHSPLPCSIDLSSHPTRRCNHEVSSYRAASFLHPTLRSQRSEEHTSELQSRENLVCRLL